MNSLPTASSGESTSMIAATNRPTHTAAAAASNPLTGPAQRGALAGCERRASGSISSALMSCVRSRRPAGLPGSALGDGDVLALVGAGVPLARAADLLVLVLEQFLPVRQPAD